MVGVIAHLALPLGVDRIRHQTITKYVTQPELSAYTRLVKQVMQTINAIDAEVEAAMENIDAEYEALCAEMALVTV